MYQRFTYEIRIAAAIQNHFNIVKIYDFGKTSTGLPYMVTEYITGQTLRDILDFRRTFGFKEACYIVSQLCDALNELHIRGIIHRDVKSQNIYLLSDSTVKLADFGISIFMNDKNPINERKKIIGTPQYLAPEIIEGGKTDDSVGYFVQPTVILAKDPHYRSMVEEIFGPVLTVYVYEDEELDDALILCDTSTKYGLTGAVYAQDRAAVLKISRALTHAAGNFYINEKPTGAVVGQQPFGGSRASGTNDKAGSATNMMRWVSQRAIKEVLVPDTEILLPHMF
jgi:1-pyrroline-5-carboxylate dehydrogenase